MKISKTYGQFEFGSEDEGWQPTKKVREGRCASGLLVAELAQIVQGMNSLSDQ
ncbi:MAG: hypothetical protein Q7T66_08045 [Herminiimonas sp.]|uniref:hypothetical protein n=1 Tax=Herminiimonas sp. TaxID=1926289 RepID=UPI002716344B|nr:hypothetical protein [Herminiimonas sp.]MDO9420597.1 hypothetical protein [Herminiimonas sp.]